MPQPTHATLLLWPLTASRAIASDRSNHSHVTTSQQSQKVVSPSPPPLFSIVVVHPQPQPTTSHTRLLRPPATAATHR
ncbi:hypothetical protein BHE74_00036822 [Ensete ventricosum]|uniref:Uncharacterized protein n=1 Tax=Ensete ventricosum TaxID=4639 RepID=A0A444D364_ENSVE|nr:hypothetical protein GW17_00045035 [Ensete ventricosum]RWW56460.1 hypothetical protein BHE74_00036822 [Ensete ventricosum]RZR75286.1 hypothetical protein BHM03_00053809 [Ensete ventricosum]